MGRLSLKLSIIMVAAQCLVGCSSHRYVGIDLRQGHAPTAIQTQARAARAGDKQAQFALGERFERGEGVDRDLARAGILYRAAATDSGGTKMIFVPQRGGAVNAVAVKTGSLVLGLEQAKTKLQKLAIAESGIRIQPTRASTLVSNDTKLAQIDLSSAAQLKRPALSSVDFARIVQNGRCKSPPRTFYRTITGLLLVTDEGSTITNGNSETLAVLFPPIPATRILERNNKDAGIMRFLMRRMNQRPQNYTLSGWEFAGGECYFQRDKSNGFYIDKIN